MESFYWRLLKPRSNDPPLHLRRRDPAMSLFVRILADADMSVNAR
jgi:hypothetical protein